MPFKILALDIGTASYSFVIARELRNLGHHVILGIPFNNKISLEFLLSLKGYKKVLYPDPAISKQKFVE